MEPIIVKVINPIDNSEIELELSINITIQIAPDGTKTLSVNGFGSTPIE